MIDVVRLRSAYRDVLFPGVRGYGGKYNLDLCLEAEPGRDGLWFSIRREGAVDKKVQLFTDAELISGDFKEQFKPRICKLCEDHLKGTDESNPTR